tara:strand:+ start:322 stop:591 length:270 start_codon:yes stop_codon:yes gene_type:complete
VDVMKTNKESRFKMNKHTRETLLQMDNNIDLYNYVKTVRVTNLFKLIMGMKFLFDSGKIITPDWFDFNKAEMDSIKAKVVEIRKEREVV